MSYDEHLISMAGGDGEADVRRDHRRGGSGMPCMSCGGPRNETPLKGCLHLMNHLNEATRRVIAGRLAADDDSQQRYATEQS